MSQKLVLNEDYYIDKDNKYIFTENFHLKRGFCCKSKKGCKHCPWIKNKNHQ